MSDCPFSLSLRKKGRTKDKWEIEREKKKRIPLTAKKKKLPVDTYSLSCNSTMIYP